MTPPGSERIELSIPAAAEWLALARTTGAAIASRSEFSYDEIADLRLAIDELCLTLIEGPPAERIRLEYVLDGNALTVTGETMGVVPGKPATNGLRDLGDMLLTPAELSARILDALVDDHGSQSGDSERKAWLRKLRTSERA